MRYPKFLSSYLIVFASINRISFIRSEENEKECHDYSNQVLKPLGAPSEYTNSSIGIKLAVRKWLPENEDVKGVILFHHGGAGFHSGYSDILGQFMKSNNVVFISYDQVGFGYSDSMKGSRNYFDMEVVTDDFSKILNEVRSQYPNKKVIAMGESFGSMVLLYQILKKPSPLTHLADAYIFSGPVVKVLPEMLPPKPIIFFVKILSKFFPMLPTPATDFFSTFDLAFGDQRWAKVGREDPFIQETANTPPKLGTGASVLSAMMHINKNLDKVNVPFKIFMGENEVRVDVNAIKRLAEVASSQDKSIEIVPGAYHQLYQDLPEVTKNVCEGVLSWALEHF